MTAELSPRSPRRPPPLRTESPCFVPSSQKDLSNLVQVIAAKLLLNKEECCLNNEDFESILVQNHGKWGNANEQSRKMFLRFVVDLVQNIMTERFRLANEKQNPAWMRQKPLSKLNRAIPADENELIQSVQREVLIAFNHQKKAQKENLIIRWSQKRRDRVDEVLVRELHAEEMAWTNYQDDEVNVKDEISNQIMDALIQDTARAFGKLLSNRRR